MKNDITALLAPLEAWPTEWFEEENGAGEFWKHFVNGSTQDISPAADGTIWRLPGLGHYVNGREGSALYLPVHCLREEALPGPYGLCGEAPSLPIGILKDYPDRSSAD